MKNPQGREECEPSGNRGIQAVRILDDFSSPLLAQTDIDILSLVREQPMTVLQIAEKMDIRFVECVDRVAKLREKGLLRKIPTLVGPSGLNLYVAILRKTHEKPKQPTETEKRMP